MTELERQAEEARENLVRDVEALRAKASGAEEAIVEEVSITGTLLAGVLGSAALGLAATAFLSGPAWRAVRGALAGAASGIAAGYAMNQAHALWSAAEGRFGANEQPGGASSKPATVQAVEALAGPLRDAQKPVAGSLAHYAMATVTGAAYGVGSAVFPPVAVGRGLAYGAAVWLVADEAAVPALGLSAPPWRYPPRVHLRALVAHLVFGLVLDGGVRLLARLR